MALQKIAGDEKLVADTDRLFDRTCRRISKILGFNYWLEDGIDSAHSKLAKINSILDKASAEKVSGEIQNRERDRFLETIRVLRHDLTGTTAPLQAAIGLIDSKSDAFGLIATSIRKIGLSIDKLYRFDDRKKQERIGVAEVYLEEAISKAKAEMRDTKGAKLVLSYDPSELSGIRVDEHEFQSVLDAFLDNARVAVPDTDGVVKVSVERINNTAIITIEDNGPGVPKEFIPRLMKYGQTTGTKGELGVGLYNANEKVKSWGGVVTYEPANPGARFKILLPLAEKGMFIGLVDGEKYRVIDDLDHTVKALTEGGFEVLDSASTFYEGLDLMKRAPDDGSVILVDNRLDDDHLGTDLIKLQRRREKVYLCTNDYDDSVVIDRARALGVKILPKPLCTHAPFG
jgi:signal transduction histidine kinase